MPTKARTNKARDKSFEKSARWVEDHFDVSNGQPKPSNFERVPLTDAELQFRHGGWIARREKVRAAMAAGGTGRVALERFDTCGSQARVAYSKSKNRHYVRASYCKCRHCAPCANAKARQIAANLTNHLQRQPRGRYRFTTLTLQHSTAPLPEQIDKLFKCFNKLRKTKLFRTQHGGVWVFECKQGRDGLRHPHLHLISEGHFLPQADLSVEWEKLTGTSYVVDVRQVRNPKDIGHELTKYIAKGTSSDVWNDEEKAIEWVVAVRGRRSCGTWGTWRKFKLTKKEPLPDDLVDVGTLEYVWREASAAKPWALAIVDQLVPGDFTGDTS